jgi:DNA/RNA non-specific endonuclease
LRGSLFGLEHVAGPILYGVYINVRRGVNTFNKWMLTREAATIIGDAAKLRPDEILKLKALFNEAVAETQRVATSGARMGMSPGEIDTVIQAWAKDGGTADDVIAKMAGREVVVDRATRAGPVTRNSIPRGHAGGVLIEGPGGTYIKLLPLDAEGRAAGVVARVDSAMLAQATGAEASGKIAGRAASQDRGHLLARVLGGPDLKQNLAPLLKNINERDMRMVELEIRQAIQAGNEATITVTPIYKTGRIDPESFLMSVRWKDGSVHQVYQFSNAPLPTP